MKRKENLKLTDFLENCDIQKSTNKNIREATRLHIEANVSLRKKVFIYKYIIIIQISSKKFHFKPSFQKNYESV